MEFALYTLFKWRWPPRKEVASHEDRDVMPAFSLEEGKKKKKKPYPCRSFETCWVYVTCTFFSLPFFSLACNGPRHEVWLGRVEPSPSKAADAKIGLTHETPRAPHALTLFGVKPFFFLPLIKPCASRPAGGGGVITLKGKVPTPATTSTGSTTLVRIGADLLVPPKGSESLPLTDACPFFFFFWQHHTCLPNVRVNR